MNGKIFVKTPAKGGQGGSCWDDGPLGQARQIFIDHGDSINSIQIAYDSNGNITLSDKHGGEGGYNFDAVDLGNCSLSWITGHCGSHDNLAWKPEIVRSLKFGTDDGSVYGPFGTEEGEPFSIRLHGVRFAGFHGRSDNSVVHAIGIYVKTIATASASSAQLPALTNRKQQTLLQDGWE